MSKKDVGRRDFLKTLGMGAASAVVPNAKDGIEAEIENASDSNDPELLRAIKRIESEAIQAYTNFNAVLVNLEKITEKEAENRISEFTEKIKEMHNLNSIIEFRNMYSQMESRLRSDPDNIRELERLEDPRHKNFN